MPKYKDGPTLAESLTMKAALIVTCLASIAAVYGLVKLGVWLFHVVPAPGEY